MDRTIRKIEDLEHKIKQFKEFHKNRQIEMDFSLEDPEDEELTEFIENWEVGKGLKFKLEHLDLDLWEKDYRAFLLII